MSLNPITDPEAANRVMQVHDDYNDAERWGLAAKVRRIVDNLCCIRRRNRNDATQESARCTSRAGAIGRTVRHKMIHDLFCSA